MNRSELARKRDKSRLKDRFEWKLAEDKRYKRRLRRKRKLKQRSYLSRSSLGRSEQFWNNN